MNFDPVNDKTHELALENIVSKAVEKGMEKHNRDKHTELEKDVRSLNRSKWEQRGLTAGVAALLTWLGFN